MKTLIAKILGRPKTTTAATVTVYSRKGCGCCEQALRTLKAAQKQHRLTIEVVDVDRIPDLKAIYDTQVPVIMVNGKVRFRGKINPVLLDRLLCAETG